MSNQKSNDISVPVPDCFRSGDGIEASSAVTEVIGAIGGAPRGWEAALQRARQAEFALFRATSTGVAEDVARLEAHLAEVTARRRTATGMAIADLDLGISNTTLLIQNARTLLAAVPEEAARIATRRAREDRQRRYERRATPTNDAEVSAMLDLADQVHADTEAQAAEQRVVEGLSDDVLAAHRAATKILVRELTSSIHDAARLCKSAVGSKALRHAAFPQHADPAIGRSYSRALYLSGLVQRLVGAAPEPGVEAVFRGTIGEDDWRTIAGVLRQQVGRYPIEDRPRRG